MSKKRYMNVETGTIFCVADRVDQDTIDLKVKAREWVARPDLDEAAEKELAEREQAEKPQPRRARKAAESAPAEDAPASE